MKNLGLWQRYTIGELDHLDAVRFAPELVEVRIVLIGKQQAHCLTGRPRHIERGENLPISGIARGRAVVRTNAERHIGIGHISEEQGVRAVPSTLVVAESADIDVFVDLVDDLGSYVARQDHIRIVALRAREVVGAVAPENPIVGPAAENRVVAVASR